MLHDTHLCHSGRWEVSKTTTKHEETISVACQGHNMTFRQTAKNETPQKNFENKTNMQNNASADEPVKMPDFVIFFQPNIPSGGKPD